MKQVATYSKAATAILIGLLGLLSACSFRELLDEYPVSGVQIEIDWSGMNQELPEHVRVIFYPKDEQGRYVESIIAAKGEEMKVPPGRYSVVAYSYNNPVVKVRNDSRYETIEAFTGPCTGLNTSIEMVWAPEAFYSVAQDEVMIEDSATPARLKLHPKQATEHYRFETKVKGLQYVSGIIVNVSGMNAAFRMADSKGLASEVPIYVETTLKEGSIEGRFSTFSRTGTSAKSQTEGGVIMTLLFVKTDHSVQEVKVDITAAFPPPGSEPGDEPGEVPDTNIELPLDDDVEVEEPDPGIGGGGGFEGEVDDWGQGTDIVLPMT